MQPSSVARQHDRRIIGLFLQPQEAATRYRNVLRREWLGSNAWRAQVLNFDGREGTQLDLVFCRIAIEGL